MTGCRLRITTLLLLLVTVVFSCSVGSVVAEAAPTRHLLQQTDHILEELDTHVENSVTSATKSSSTSDLESGDSTTINTEASAAEVAEPVHEGLTFMSFTGPMLAGVLSIVLIGAVVAFKNRKAKQ